LPKLEVLSGEQIKEIRVNEFEMTQKEFGNQFGISDKTIWNYEHDKKTPNKWFFISLFAIRYFRQKETAFAKAV